METNNNTQNDNVSEPRPVRAPGFANREVAGGDTSGRVMPVSGGNDVVFQDKPKKNHGMLYGMILLAILAAGGIGFGVWAMLDGNSRVQKKDEQVAELNNQVESLQQEKNDLSERIDELENSHLEAQADIVQNQEDIAEVQEQLAEEQKQEESGYRVESIGQCVADGGTVASSVFILKCEATTSQGAGKFVYNSQDNVLRFVLGQ